MAHYWNPTPMPGAPRGGIRHAFRGARWMGEPTAVTVCGVRVPMSQPTQVDWIFQPTCKACWDALIAERR